jgi:hypothetical protein
MMSPMRTRMKAPRIVPRAMNIFLVDLDIAGLLEAVDDGAVVVDVGDESGFAKEKDEVVVEDAVDDTVEDVVEELLDESVVVVDEVEGESIELSSESPISSSCVILFVVVAAAAAVVVAVPSWATDNPNAQNRTTSTL